jgi:outer membrane receptor for ferrienterochelin and colicins
MMKASRATRGLLLCALLGTAGAAGAQTPAHVLAGRVVEQGSERPIAGAVVVLDAQRRLSTLTAEDGRWSFTALPEGAHALRVQHIGFASHTATVRVPAERAGELRIEMAPRALALDAVVVTASRRPQRLADTPVTTELVTRQEIAQAGVADLSAALAERTGVQLSGGRPTGEGVMLQGFSSERVLVLVDGQPLGGRIAGTLDVSRIPVSMIERVEVVKGSQSALYGTDAMGGVVNIVTRTPEPGGWRAGAELTGGTGGRLDAGATLHGTLGEMSLLAQAGRRATDIAPGRADQTDALAERWDGLARLQWSRGAWSVDAGALVFDEFQRWRTGQLFYFVDNAQRSARLTAARALGDDRVTATLFASEFEHLFRRATTLAPAGPDGDRETQRLLRAEVLYNRTAGGVPLDLGLDATRESRGSDRFDDLQRTLHTLDPFAQATLSLGTLSVVPGLRLSWSEQWGRALTPRVAALYRPVEPLALRASVGRGYRAPNFEELYLEFLNVGPGFGYLVRGNPSLRPETSTNLAAGAEWARGRGYARVQGFHNRFDDFIENHVRGDSSGVTVYSYGNIAEGVTRGVELEGGWTWRGGRAEGGYSVVHTRDVGSEQPLLGRPSQSGRLSVQQALPFGVRGSGALVYTGTTPIRHTEARTIARDGFFRIDARLARTLPYDVELSLGGRNLTDVQPAEWPGFVGRHLYVGLGWGGR